MTEIPKEKRFLKVPRVYVYGGPREVKNQLHPLLDMMYLDGPPTDTSEWRAWFRWYGKLRYSPNHGEFDLYFEPSNPGCPCA